LHVEEFAVAGILPALFPPSICRTATKAKNRVKIRQIVCKALDIRRLRDQKIFKEFLGVTLRMSNPPWQNAPVKNERFRKKSEDANAPHFRSEAIRASARCPCAMVELSTRSECTPASRLPLDFLRNRRDSPFRRHLTYFRYSWEIIGNLTVNYAKFT
jgi:hypothetical protein